MWTTSCKIVKSFRFSIVAGEKKNHGGSEAARSKLSQASTDCISISPRNKSGADSVPHLTVRFFFSLMSTSQMSGPVMSELLFRHDTAADCFTETTSLTQEQLYGSVKMHLYTEDDDLEVFFLFPALLPPCPMFTLSVFISRLEYSSLSIFPRQSWIHQWGHVFWEFHARKQSDKLISASTIWVMSCATCLKGEILFLLADCHKNTLRPCFLHLSQFSANPMKWYADICIYSRDHESCQIPHACSGGDPVSFATRTLYVHVSYIGPSLAQSQWS